MGSITCLHPVYIPSTFPLVRSEDGWMQPLLGTEWAQETRMSQEGLEV